MEKYVLVKWPFSQQFMEHPSFDECYLLTALDNQEHFDSAYFVPLELYREVMNNDDSNNECPQG